MEILNLLDNNPKTTFVSLATKLGVTDRTISNVKADAVSIRQRYNTGNPATRDARKRPVASNKSGFEDEMYNWVAKLRARKVELPPSFIMQRARAKASDHGLDTFKASPGWFYRFMRRYGLTCASLLGEGGDVDPTNLDLINSLNQLRTTIASYHPDNVYNMDETGLLYRILPHYTVLCPGEVKDARGKKPAKDRVSLLVCTNASGTHKVPLLMVGRAKQPACLKGGTDSCERAFFLPQ